MYTDSGFKQPLDGYVYPCTQEIVIPQKYTGLITVTWYVKVPCNAKVANDFTWLHIKSQILKAYT